MRSYSFHEQLTKGEAAERELDEFFGQWYGITPASMDDQLRGIDRWLSKSGRPPFPVEYKADWTASRTGRCFLETVANDATGKLDWAYTTQADWLVYYLPVDHRAYLIKVAALRHQMPTWRLIYSTCWAQNATYRTGGIAVPQDKVERLAEWVVDISRRAA